MAHVGRGTSRSLSDNGQQQPNQRQPVRFRPIGPDEDASAPSSPSRNEVSRLQQRRGSAGSDVNNNKNCSSDLTSTSNLARNHRSNMEICCSAALSESNSSLVGASLGAPTRTPICLKHRLSRLFCSERMADVHFILTGQQQPSNNQVSEEKDDVAMDESLEGSANNGNPVRIPAHKLLLAVASPVFDAMFNGLMSDQPVQQDIVIPDVDIAAFMAMLKFIYTDHVELTPETVMVVLYAAKKYAVDSLQERCVEYLRSNLTRDNAFVLLSQARLFDEPQLASLCLDVIDRHTNEAMATESFLEIDAETLCAVLRRDTLCIREDRVFTHVNRWAEHECSRLDLEVNIANKRRVLGPALNLIRFPLMSPEEFANGAAQSGLLENNELVSVFLWYLASPRPSQLPLFSTQPRCCTAGRELVVSRFQHIESRWGYSGTPDRVRFTVSRPIYIVGLGLFGSVTSGGHFNAVVQLLQCDTREVRGHVEVEFDTDGSKKPHVVRFSEPVAIDANVPYLACATIRGPDTFYGTRGMSEVTVELLRPELESRLMDAMEQGGGGSATSSSGAAKSSGNKNSSSSSSVTFSFNSMTQPHNGTSQVEGQIPDIIFFP